MADYGYRGPPKPHPTGYMYPPDGARDMSVQRLNVPLLLVMAGAFALISITGGITYTATIQFTEIRTAIERLTDKLTTELSGQSERIGRIEKDMSERTADRYTRSDHDVWCRLTEQMNQNWKCADLGQRSRLNFWPQQGN